jgi:acetylornithine/N-succinyldiaminopimelate aminotransferase
MVRRYHQHNGNTARTGYIACFGAFHGRTLAATAVGDPSKHAGLGPLLPNILHVPFGDAEAMAAAVTPSVGAILVEPIQGEGGICVPHPDYLRQLRALCDAHGILLILDEIQCGMGRTGTLFAYMESGITPDIVTTAKGIGGGFPLAACLATADAAKGMAAGTHGSTYGGNPLAMAVGNAVLDILLAPTFLDEVAAKGAWFGAKLAALAAAYPQCIEAVRGTGLMRGLRLHHDPKEVAAALRTQHLLTVPAGDHVLRLLPPLTITYAELEEGLDKLARGMASIIG